MATAVKFNRSTIFTTAWNLVKTAGETLSNALKQAWNMAKSIVVSVTDTLKENFIRSQKFNGKIYGKSGNYSIYVNGDKVQVTDEQVKEYNSYLKQYEELKEYKIGNIRICLADFAKSKPMVYPTFEALLYAKETLQVETIYNGEIQMKDNTISNIECIAVKNDEFSRIFVWQKYGDNQVREQSYKYTEENLEDIKRSFE